MPNIDADARDASADFDSSHLDSYGPAKLHGSDGMAVRLLGICLAASFLLTACGDKPVADAIKEAGGMASSPKVATKSTVVSQGEEQRGDIRKQTAEEVKQGTKSRLACTTRTMSLEQNPDNFVLFNPQAGIVYPGALIQGKSYETAGSMLPIAAPRGPGTVTLDIASGTSGAVSAKLDKVEHSTVTQAINDILSKYDALTPAKVSFSMREVQSAKQLAAEVNANVRGATFDIASALSFGENSTSSKLLVELKQEYFTMAFQTPEKPEQVFGPDVDVEALKTQMGPGNPPVYVGSVTYGRIFYLLFEGDTSVERMKASLSGAYKAAIEADGSAKLRSAEELKDTRVSSYALGGSASGALAASRTGADGIEALWKFIVDDANFSPQSPGAPISYKIVNLADNTPIRMASTTTYDVKDCKVATIGCDGVDGSTKVKDSCGVCGGSNACNAGCGALKETFGNDKVFIYVELPASGIGKRIKISDLAVAQYYFPRCYRVKTDNLRYVCQGGRRGGSWRRSGVIIRDALCTSKGNWNQSYIRVRKQE